MTYRTPSFTFLFGILTAFASGAMAAPRGPNTPGGYQQQQSQIQILKFVSSNTAPAGGHKHLFVILTPLTGSGSIRLMVPNTDQNSNEPKPQIADAVEGLKAGDVVRAEIERVNGIQQIKSIKRVEVKPGEENSHGYVFDESYNDQSTNQPIVRLTKYGEIVEFPVAQVRGEKGKAEPDPQVQGALDKFKKGDLVYVQVMPGRQPVLTGIYPYKEPQTGKVAKVADEEVEGQKVPAVQIDADGKSITALVPGKTVNKRFVPDVMLARQVRSLKAGNEVQFLTYADGDKTYLIDIAKAPPAPRARQAGAEMKRQ